MTAEHDEWQNDPILAALGSLRTRDVSQRRADRLRRRCYTLLQAPAEPKPSVVTTMIARTFQRIVAPALGGAWCLAYLVELFRRALAVYFVTP